MASLRNLAIGIRRACGDRNLAAALHRNAPATPPASWWEVGPGGGIVCRFARFGRSTAQERAVG